jgi:flagellar biosynthesis/type III secretory pathway protein FliH
MTKEEAWAKYQLFNIAEARTVAIDPYEDAFDAGWEEGRKALVEEAERVATIIESPLYTGEDIKCIEICDLKELAKEGEG